jgi:maleate isomerase
VSSRRLGVVIPAANTTLEAEFPFILAGIATCHFHRFTTLVRTVADLDEAARGIAAAADTLAAARVSVVGVGYTAGSFLGGTGWDADLRRTIEDASGVPVLTAASAIVHVLRSNGLGRVAVVSPYSTAVNDQLRAYLQGGGIGIAALVGSPLPGAAGDLPIAEVEALALAVDRSEADGFLISCTGLRTATLLDSLEVATGLPVISSGQALALAMLEAVGSTDRVSGYGSLLAARTTRPT